MPFESLLCICAYVCVCDRKCPSLQKMNIETYQRPVVKRNNNGLKEAV